MERMLRGMFSKWKWTAPIALIMAFLLSGSAAASGGGADVCPKPVKADPSVTLTSSVTPEGCVTEFVVGGTVGFSSVTVKFTSVDGQTTTTEKFTPGNMPEPYTVAGSYDVFFDYLKHAVVRNNPNGKWVVVDNCGPPVEPEPCVNETRGAVKKLDKCRTKGDRFAVRQERGLIYKVNGKVVREGVWLKTHGALKVVVRAFPASDKWKNVGPKKWVLRYTNKPCHTPHNPPPAGE